MLPDISWRAHLLLLGVLRPGAGISSQAAGGPAGRHRFPVQAGLLSPKRMPTGHPLLNSVLPEHSVPTSSPAAPKPPLGDFLRAGDIVRAAFTAIWPSGVRADHAM